MEKFDIVDKWIVNVQYSHSKSKATESSYRSILKTFTSFMAKTPQQIQDDYNNTTDREFKRKYAQTLQNFIVYLSKQGCAPGTIRSYVGVVKSFFKYTDLPLGYVPVGRSRSVYHNRDITREEIVQILAYANLRDKAYFCMMAQSGLRPVTLNKLRYEHIQKDFEAGVIPLKIDVPPEIAKGQYRSYFTFVGPETVRFLRLYLKTRPHIRSDDYLFACLRERKNKQLTPKSPSRTFSKITRKLEKCDALTIKKRVYRKPAEIRLYNLRKFFRKYATPAGFEYVQFWMGHIVREGVDEHYRPKDPEFHRKLYAEKAMPFLRLETSTPSETEKIIKKQQEEIERLKKERITLAKEIADIRQKVELLFKERARE